MSITEVNEKYPVFIVHMIEDSEYYKDVAKKILKLNGLPHTHEFDGPDEYEKYLEENPDLTIHIAIVDYKFPSGLTGIDITRNLFDRCRHKRVKTRVIMITGLGFSNPQEVNRFYYNYKGFCWLDKNRNSFVDEFKEALQFAVGEIKQAYEDLAFLVEIKNDEPEPNEKVNDDGRSNI